MAWADKKDARYHASEIQVPKGRVLDEKFWLQWGDNPEPSMREKIVFVSIDDLGRVGPSTFNVKLVCDALGVSYSLINHHFGNRDELIAEAVIRAYSNYVEILWAAARAAKRTPEARLRAWLEASLEWSRDFSGLGALLNYPTASLDVTYLIREKWEPILNDWGELNLARLLRLVKDYRAGTVSDQIVEIGNVPRVNLLADAKATMAMASVGWALLGLAVWGAGKHLPSGNVPEAKAREKIARKYHLDNIMQLAKGKIVLED